MVQIALGIIGIICLFQNQIKVNKTKAVRGVPIKILGVMLIGCAASLTFIPYLDFVWIIFACLGLVFVYIVAIIVLYAQPIESDEALGSPQKSQQRADFTEMDGPHQ